MTSRRIPHSPEFSSVYHRAGPPTTWSPAGRLLLVAALAGFGLVALAVTSIGPSDRDRAAESAPATTAPAPAAEKYFRARFLIDAKANKPGVVTYERD